MVSLFHDQIIVLRSLVIMCDRLIGFTSTFALYYLFYNPHHPEGFVVLRVYMLCGGRSLRSHSSSVNLFIVCFHHFILSWFFYPLPLSLTVSRSFLSFCLKLKCCCAPVAYWMRATTGLPGITAHGPHQEYPSIHWMCSLTYYKRYVVVHFAAL